MTVVAVTPAAAPISAWRSVSRVYRFEVAKLCLQLRTRVAVLLCLAGPPVFMAVANAQSTLPTDTLFGRWLHESGYASALVILGFCGQWAIPALVSIVAGDMFSAEDRFGTWQTLLIRSCTRAQIFAGKALAAGTYTVFVVVLLAASSIASAELLGNDGALVGLSGQPIPTGTALGLVAGSWASVLPPALAFTALGLLMSVASRYSPVGVGVPIVVGLMLQVVALAQLPVPVRMALPPTAFNAWQGLFVAQPFYGPLVQGSLVSIGYAVVTVSVAALVLQGRDLGRSRV